MGVNGETDQNKINIGSILDQYKITSFNRLHIPPKMFVDLNFTIINLTNFNIHRKLNGLIPNMITIPKQVQWMKNWVQ